MRIAAILFLVFNRLTACSPKVEALPLQGDYAKHCVIG